MKKIVIYSSVFVILLGSLVTFLLVNKNINNNIYDSIVYIEAISDELITSGSGFVYKSNNKENYIVTSYHIIEKYNDIYIYNNKKEKIKADIVGYDEYTDIAVLKIKDQLGLRNISIGNSEKVSLYEEIFVIGTPNNINNINKKVEGIITYINKPITINTTHGSSNFKAFEVKVLLDYGNSGSALLNKNGNVIGMIFVKEESNVLGYALPINFVMDIVEKIENNELNRPNLGAVMCNTTNSEALNEYGIVIDDIEGVVILEVSVLGILDSIGIKKGDIITKFDGKIVSNVNELREVLYNKQIGESVVIEYYSNGNNYKVDVEL